MKRILIYLFFLVLHSSVIASVVQPEIRVDGKYIKLGDLFSGLSKKTAAVDILIAPDPGKSMMLDQDWLTSIARKYGIDYTPVSRIAHVKVTSSCEVVSKDEIDAALKGALEEQLKTGDFTISIDNPDIQFYAPKDEIVDIVVSRTNVNTNHTRFHATVTVHAKNKDYNTKQKITGKIHHMVLVPMLNKDIPKGRMIMPEDIEWSHIAKQVANNAVLTEESMLVGSYPKRQDLKAYQPIKKQDVEVPQLVARNQAVLILASSPLMSVTAKGKALENGKKDDYVKVMNIDSKKILYATVIGPQKVRVDFARGTNNLESN